LFDKWATAHYNDPMDKQNEKSCATCAHYIQHYVLIKGEFFTIFSGHCRRTYPNGHRRKCGTSCEAWEIAPAPAAARERTIRETLKDISQKLNKIENILKFPL